VSVLRDQEEPGGVEQRFVINELEKKEERKKQFNNILSF